MARSKKKMDDFELLTFNVEQDGIPLMDIARVGVSFLHKKKVYRINKIERCEKDWRSHVHINKDNCFDERCLVKVV